MHEKRNPRTKATINQLLNRYLEFSTRDNYVSDAKKHIRPLLGETKVDAGVMDSLYTELRAVPRPLQEHQRPDRSPNSSRTRMRRPMPTTRVPTAVRLDDPAIHFILQGALRAAGRWKWVTIKPIADAEPPPAPKAPVALGALDLWAGLETIAVIESEVFDSIFAGLVDANDEGTAMRIGTAVPTVHVPFSEQVIDELDATGRLAPETTFSLRTAWKHRSQLLAR